MSNYDIVVIGASAGGLNALQMILSNLDKEIITPIVVVLHMSPDSGDSVLKVLDSFSNIRVLEPDDKDDILENRVYIAPPDYHLTIESDKSFSLSLGPKVNFCRPSIDLLFETAAETYYNRTLGIILTGANRDGTDGAKVIKKFSGTVIVQNPEEAVVDTMPIEVIENCSVDSILNLNGIYELLNSELKG